MDKCFIGMWRYATTKKLRKRINKASVLKLSFKLDGTQEWKSCCGMKDEFRSQCPFYCRVNGKSLDVGNVQYMDNHRCLAPNNDKSWFAAKKEGKSFISPSYEKKGYMVVGCYIAIFCELGLATYNRLKPWRRKYERIRSFEMAIQRHCQT